MRRKKITRVAKKHMCHREACKPRKVPRKITCAAVSYARRGEPCNSQKIMRAVQDFLSVFGRLWSRREAVKEFSKLQGLVCARSSLSFMASPTPEFGARWQYRPFGEILSSLRNSAKRLAAASDASPASDSQ